MSVQPRSTVLINPENPQLLNSNLSAELKSKNYCKQALAIYNITHYLPAPQSLKKYRSVVVYYSYLNPTDQKTYFMIDNKGQVLKLTHSINISASDGYLELNNKYPAKAGDAPTLSSYANDYPGSSNLPEGGLRLIFAQDITFGNCATCAKVGEAKIAYDFDKKGYYVQSEVVSVSTK